jgi:hypothetical protein
LAANYSHNLRYSAGLALLTIVTVFGGYFLFSRVLYSPMANVYPFLAFFVAGVTLLVHIIMVRAVKERPQKFVNLFMLANTAKLFGYLTIMVIFALLKKDLAVPFVLSFFCLYIIYTFYDVTVSNRYFRKS